MRGCLTFEIGTKATDYNDFLIELADTPRLTFSETGIYGVSGYSLASPSGDEIFDFRPEFETRPMLCSHRLYVLA
jgi:hypothetical protein